MKHLALLSLVLVSSVGFAAPKRITTFAQMMDRLNAGCTVNLVLDYSKMNLLVDGEVVESPKAIGGMTFSPWEFFDKGVVRNEQAYVVSSETHMISHPRYGYVNNYVRVKVFADNSVEVTARYITLNDQKTVMDETFKGTISSGKDKAGVHVFSN